MLLSDNTLKIVFPHIAPDAGATIDFRRTLRVPDNGQNYPLPPGLGRFPLRHIEDCAFGDADGIKVRGGIVLPMHQSEAMWLNFSSLKSVGASLPVAIKIGAGKINAISGKPWAHGLSKTEQDYVVVPNQEWLDGFSTGDRQVRQFVATPLGTGRSVGEQLTGAGNIGGLQIEVFPMKPEYYAMLQQRGGLLIGFCEERVGMGFGFGGRIQQDIATDRHGLDAWDTNNSQRCFVTLANSAQWKAITGETPPLKPIDAETYTKLGLPWYAYYDEAQTPLTGSNPFEGLSSAQPERDGHSIAPLNIQPIGPDHVREGDW